MKKLFANWRWFLALAALAWYAASVRRAIKELSPTYDEHFHLTAGYVILETRDYAYQARWHPPLAELISAIPLEFSGLKQKPLIETSHPAYKARRNYEFADFFMYKNRTDPASMLRSGRWACWIFFVPFVLVSLWFLSIEIGKSKINFQSAPPPNPSPSRREGAGEGDSEPSGMNIFFWSLLLFCIEPNLLAHGTLVTTDFASAAFYITSLAAAVLFSRYPSYPSAAALGFSLALSLLSKYTNVISLGPIALYFYLEHRRISAEARGHTRDGSIQPRGGQWVAAAFSFFVGIMVIYQGSDPSIYWDGLGHTLTQAKQGRSSFFWGTHSTQGWLLYFPVALALKSNLAVLVPFAVSNMMIFWQWRRYFDPLTFTLLLTPLLHFVMACTSKTQIGLRYVLPVYPFVILLGGWALFRIEQRSRKWAMAAAGLVLAGWVSTARTAPWYVAYFNELAGGPAKGYRIFTDSNNDWGQGLGALSGYVKQRGVKSVYLSYFGVGDPNYYGLNYIPVGMITNTIRPGNLDQSPTREGRIYLAVSATNLQATYFADKKIFDWLKKMEPEKIFAYSIFLYDLTDNPAALEKLASLIEFLGAPDEAGRIRSLLKK